MSVMSPTFETSPLRDVVVEGGAAAALHASLEELVHRSDLGRVPVLDVGTVSRLRAGRVGAPSAHRSRERAVGGGRVAGGNGQQRRAAPREAQVQTQRRRLAAWGVAPRLASAKASHVRRSAQGDPRARPPCPAVLELRRVQQGASERQERLVRSTTALVRSSSAPRQEGPRKI